MSIRAIALLTLVAFATGAAASSAAAAVTHRLAAESARPASPPGSTHTAPVTRAPSSPPLTAGETSTGAAPGGEEGAGITPQAQADPLVSNGLGSPSCKGALAGELPPASRRDCETSGFAAAPAPTGDYGFDVHIDSGVLNVGSWGSSVAQDLFVTPLWMALVWAVHALIVMLEWSFTVDLLDSATTAGVGSGLRQMQASLTDPWLPVALAVASGLAVYHGLIRRRVAETLGETALMGAMMIGGMWVVIDPTGTVGALGQWANQAAVGTLAVAAQGTPSGQGQALGTGLDTVFAAAIEAPWCYLEFGDEGWCREPSRRDGRLRAAALKIAAAEDAQLGCAAGAAALTRCAVASGAQAKALEHSAELLHGARSNGAIFLALPANGPARNSINEQGSLLRSLCQSSEATNCRGPTAAQAEFRTASGTLWRIGGVVAIGAGLLGMLLALGFVALRLLTAAIFSLLYLLLAPAMVLAPAFGEGGRALFRGWAARLLGAVVSKLVFSFLLGMLLSVIAILSRLEALGWWTQWLLMSAFWWGAYARRNQVIAVADGAFSHERSTGERTQRHTLVRRMREMVEGNQLVAAARWAKNRHSTPAPDVGQPRKLARPQGASARAGTDVQVLRILEGERREASGQAQLTPQINGRLSAKRAQLERLGRARSGALASGGTRRAAELGQRVERVTGEVEIEQERLRRARLVASEAGRRTLRAKRGEAYTSERMQERGRFLDTQAALPAAARARRTSERRDYASLSALAGYQRERYERLGPRDQRAARLEIDRELALRRELAENAGSSLGADTPTPRASERRSASGQFESAPQARMRDTGPSVPVSRGERPTLDALRESEHAERSSVLSDAREVAARRKRQLGIDRP